jgi:hypothetical protein
VLITGSRSKIPNPLPCVANGKTGAVNAGHPGVGENDSAAHRRAQWHYLAQLSSSNPRSNVDGELPNPHIPIIPGYQIVGRIDAVGAGVKDLHKGERVGIPWLGHTCGVCPYCVMHRENLCDRPLFTGFTRDGGYATATIADDQADAPMDPRLDLGGRYSCRPTVAARSVSVAVRVARSQTTAKATPRPQKRRTTKRLPQEVAKHYNVLRIERHDKINIVALKRHQTFGRINNSGQAHLHRQAIVAFRSQLLSRLSAVEASKCAD